MDRLEKLRALEADLLAMMREASPRDMASLARQYRETLRDIDAIENGEDADDEVAAIILRHRQPAPDD